MDNLKSLEKKVEDKVKVNEPIMCELLELKGISNEDILNEIQRVYRLVNNTTKRIEKQNQYIEDKINIVLNLLKYKEVDTYELKKLQEIEELEQKLKKLKKEV